MTSTLTAACDTSLTGDASALLDTLGLLADDRHALAEWLHTFADPEQAVRVASQSYWHPNGFAKLVLRAGAAGKTRLHVWPAGEGRLGESNPHGHRWNFASTVLCGDGLTDVHYEEAETGLRYRRYGYLGSTVNALMPVGEVNLRECGRQDIRTHQRYTVDTSVVHTVRPLGTALVATLVVQGPSLHQSTAVYCAPGVDPNEPVTSVSADDVRELVRGVLAAFGG